jgi:lysophospholipase L1-like esterase
MPIRIPVLLCALGAALVLPATAGAAERYYVSLGDSYATGYQATAPGKGKATRKGYANQLVREARERGHDFRLVNFGCGGETTTSILNRKKACRGPAIGGPRYAGRTQVEAATRFLRRHRGEVGLVTISIGGNDVTACVEAAEPIGCVDKAVKKVERNVRVLVRRVRAAAGPRVRIVGLTYPDVVLGEWVKGTPEAQELARLSVIGFRDLLNPALKRRFEAVDATFVDVTAASGAYGSFDELVSHAPYDSIPRPVADACHLTYYCEFGDIHARTRGYRLIAELIAATLPLRT